jgi:drug/metabolite transporter (DMT)-like permease
LKSDVLLLLTAIIWGGGFVAQRMGMEHVGPFTFNGIRFALGSVSLLPLYLIVRKHGPAPRDLLHWGRRRSALLGAGLAGSALFLGATLQQVGLVYTTAGKAGFITGLYVILVPFFGLFWGQRAGRGTWLGALIATAGLYLLSITEDLTISLGDLLELIGAFFWAAHLLILGWVSPRMNPLKLAIMQFAACSALSLAVAVCTESIAWRDLSHAVQPILYGGLVSVGVAYTLQVVAQRDAHPAHAAILLSMEAVFAAAWGWLFLGETLAGRGMAGCALMLVGMLLSQLTSYVFPTKAAKSAPENLHTAVSMPVIEGPGKNASNLSRAARH